MCFLEHMKIRQLEEAESGQLSKYSILLPVPLPDGATVSKKGDYLVVNNANGHPIAGLRGAIPYHRFVLYESLGRPEFTKCSWCGYVLPWKTTISSAVCHVVNADHLDGDKTNNAPQNLVPSCSWCNKNRNWAEPHKIFWNKWREWMRDVPPFARPDLIEIARDFGIDVRDYWAKNEQKTRQRPMPEKDGTCFKSDDAGMFVSVESLVERDKKQRIEELKILAKKAFEGEERRMMRHSEIVSRIRDASGVSQRTAERRFRQLSDEGILRSQVSGLYHLDVMTGTDQNTK